VLAACTALVGLSAIAAIDPAPGRQADKRTKLLFSSGFEHPVTVAPPRTEKGDWRFPIRGADEGFAWQSELPGGKPHAFFPIVPASVPVGPYADTRLETVPGPHGGTPTRALYQEVSRDVEFTPNKRVRNQFPTHWKRERGSLAYWIKLQANLAQLMPKDGTNYWRQLIEFRGSWQHRTDYRLWIGVVRGPRGSLLHWRTTAELRPRKGGRIIDFTHNAHRPPIPLGKWFRFKVRWVLDRKHGFLKATVDGVPIINRRGRTRINDSVDTEQIFKVYMGANSLDRGPAYQWIDDVQLRTWPPR
jgi:hypothetical protein